MKSNEIDHLYIRLCRRFCFHMLAKKSSKVALSLLIVLVAFLGFNSVTGTEFNNGTTATNFAQEAPATANRTQKAVAPSNEDLSNQKVITENNSISFKASNSLFAGLAKDGTPIGFTVSDSVGNVGSITVSPTAPVTNPDGYVLISYVKSIDFAENLSLSILFATELGSNANILIFFLET